MKDLKDFINEKLDINAQYDSFGFHPENKIELLDLIRALLPERGPKGNYNDIDVSKITDMSGLFSDEPLFNGDITKWNTKRVKNMAGMFMNTGAFNRDISGWDTSNVENMDAMFYCAWAFKKDISKWNVKKVKHNMDIFERCPLEDKPEFQPKFKTRDIRKITIRKIQK